MSHKVSVLVVDDSAFARAAISKTLGADPLIEIVGRAKDGIEAVEQVKSLRPNVVTLDVSMPNMDGLEALSKIMSECPTPVVMLSALTGENTGATIEALEKGAVDFFLKSSVMTPAGDEDTSAGLIRKVKMAATVPIAALKPAIKQENGHVRAPIQKVSSRVRNKVLVIASSTGGPRALGQVVPAIPRDIPASILIVQHMPAGFTKSLADRLNASSEIEVREARDGDRLERGVALIAPGGYHMVVERAGTISLNQEPHVCGVRPSADVTMKSIASVYGSSTRAVVLTGMGADGTDGSKAIKQVCGKVVVEHESTCAVYGMPKSIVEAGLADSILRLPRIAGEIVRMCNE